MEHEQHKEEAKITQILDKITNIIKTIVNSKFVRFFVVLFIAVVEVIVSYIFINRGGFFVVNSFDHYFNGVFDGVFAIDFKIILVKLGDVFQLIVAEDLTHFYYILYDKIAAEPHPLLKIVVFFKFFIFAVLICTTLWHSIKQSLKQKKIYITILNVLKWYVLFMFLLTGAMHVATTFDAGVVIEIGDMFSRDSLKEAFYKNKLAIILVTFLIWRDLYYYYRDFLPKILKRSSGSSAPKEEHHHQQESYHDNPHDEHHHEEHHH